MLAALEKKAGELSELPARPASADWTPTGLSFHDHWAELDTAGRARLLRDLGCRVDVARTPTQALKTTPALQGPGWHAPVRTVAVKGVLVRVDFGTRLSEMRRQAARAA
jgi:hypothetical protein